MTGGNQKRTKGIEGEKKEKDAKIKLGTKALREMWKFQKPTELLIPKMLMFQVVREILQKEILAMYTKQCCTGYTQGH